MFLTTHALPIGLSIAIPLGSSCLVVRSSTNVAQELWHKNLKKPVYNPPSWVFPPVWTALYTSMGIASYIVWNDLYGSNASSSSADRMPFYANPLLAYGVQLSLNLGWTHVFFAKRLLFESALHCSALLGAVAITTAKFAKVSKVAGLLMLPYLAWVGFATVLNWDIYRLNKAKSGNSSIESINDRKKTKENKKSAAAAKRDQQSSDDDHQYHHSENEDERFSSNTSLKQQTPQSSSPSKAYSSAHKRK